MHIPLTHCKIHISKRQEVVHRREPTTAVFAVSSAVRHCSGTSIYLRANRRQWRAPLTISTANQRSPVAKRMNQVQTSTCLQRSCSDHSQKSWRSDIITINHTSDIWQSHDSFLYAVSIVLYSFYPQTSGLLHELCEERPGLLSKSKALKSKTTNPLNPSPLITG